MVFQKLGFQNNNYKIDGNITYIYITNKKGQHFDVLIDTDDLQKLIDLDQSWHIKWEPISKNYYVRSSYYYKEDGSSKKKLFNLYLHSFIMNAKLQEIVDHINHNTLDNRKQNLRIALKAENISHRKGANSNSITGVRNVNYIQKLNKYWVQIMKHGKRYKWEFEEDQFDEACEFAEKKRKEIFGKFAGNG